MPQRRERVLHEEAIECLGDAQALVDAGRYRAVRDAVALAYQFGVSGRATLGHDATRAIDARTSSRAPSGNGTAPPRIVAASTASALSSMAMTRSAVLAVSGPN